MVNLNQAWRRLATHAFYIDDLGNDIAVTRGLSRRTSAIAIANTETVVTSKVMDPAYMQVGTTFCIRAYGQLTSGVTPGSSIFRCRIGTTTLTGNIPASLTLVNGTSVTAAPFMIEILVTVRTAGSGGTVMGNVSVVSGSPAAFTVATAVSAITATVALDTTATKRIELTYISGHAGTTATFVNALIERVYQ